MADPILEQQEQQDIRSKLIRRILVAAVLVAAIGITIPLLDRLPAAPEVVQSTPTISPLQATSPATQEDTTKDKLTQAQVPEPATESADPQGQKEEPPADATQSAQPNQPPTASNEANAQLRAVNPIAPQQLEISKPVSTNPTTASGRASTSLAPTTANAQPPAKPTTLIPPVTTPAKPSVNKPVQPTEKQPSPAIAQPPLPQTPSQSFNVQAGVFINSNNAEKLLTQLKSAGIPAFLETRVQVGPFKSRAEAEIASDKLRKLGISPIVSQNPH